MLYPLQDIAAIVEAMLWERAGGTEEGWHGVMQEVEDKDFLARSWPTALCSTEEAALAAVRLTPAALLSRYKRYLKGKSVSSARAKAERVLARTQVYMPPEDMSLWTYFRTSENTVMNKGSIGKKQASFDKVREQLKALQLQVASPGAASAPSEPEPPTSAPAVSTETHSQVEQVEKVDRRVKSIHVRSNATQTDGVGEVQPPEAKGLSRVGRGKGGGVSRATKFAGLLTPFSPWDIASEPSMVVGALRGSLGTPPRSPGSPRWLHSFV